MTGGVSYLTKKQKKKFIKFVSVFVRLQRLLLQRNACLYLTRKKSRRGLISSCAVIYSVLRSFRDHIKMRTSKQEENMGRELLAPQAIFHCSRKRLVWPSR